MFTEYADTADWLVRALTAGGFTARRYSGRDLHPVRDAVRDGFARGDFQILVSTDAGNEGIDLQTAHVLVNWDIPWSLVRLEQRMGRIHRVGQTRDVELYNLIATETREGDVLEVLLRNFVTAANQLDGRMFDSLSLVGELVGLTDDRLTEVLSAAFGDDQQRAQALSAVQAVTSARLEDAAKQAAAQEAALRSAVDIAAAVAALQDEQLERINPAIVEAFLARIADGGAANSRPARRRGRDLHAHPSRRWNAPREFAPPGRPRPGQAAVVATSGAALIAARTASADVSEVISLGPSDPPFQSSGRPVCRTPCASNVSRWLAYRRDAAQPTTTCSAIGPTSPRPEGSARAPGRASSVSMQRVRDRYGGRCSPTSGRARGQQARHTPHGSTTHTVAPPLPLAKSRSDAHTPSTRGLRWRTGNSSAFPIS